MHVVPARIMKQYFDAWFCRKFGICEVAGVAQCCSVVVLFFQVVMIPIFCFWQRKFHATNLTAFSSSKKHFSFRCHVNRVLVFFYAFADDFIFLVQVIKEFTDSIWPQVNCGFFSTKFPFCTHSICCKSTYHMWMRQFGLFTFLTSCLFYQHSLKIGIDRKTNFYQSF